jgi:hydrogenase nickel incorporation protein HypA/HybF
MHELSIAMSIVELAGEEAERRGARVLAVHLKLGELSGVLKDALLSAYELAREGSPVADSELQVESVPVSVFCPTCAAERPAVSIQELRCRICGSLAGRVVRGQEMEVVALEIVE